MQTYLSIYKISLHNHYSSQRLLTSEFHLARNYESAALPGKLTVKNSKNHNNHNSVMQPSSMTSDRHSTMLSKLTDTNVDPFVIPA